MPDDVVKKVPEIDKLSWAERHGGWMLSLCLHLVLFAFLLNQFSTRSVAPVAVGRTGGVDLHMARQTPSGGLPEPKTFEPGAAQDGAGLKSGPRAGGGSGVSPAGGNAGHQRPSAQGSNDGASQDTGNGASPSVNPDFQQGSATGSGNGSPSSGNALPQENSATNSSGGVASPSNPSSPNPSPKNASPEALPSAGQKYTGSKFIQTESGEFVQERPVKEIYVPEAKATPQATSVKPDEKAKLIEKLEDLERQNKAKAQDIRVAQILQDYKQQGMEGRRALNDHRNEIKGRLQTAEIGMAAFKSFPEYGGARVGAIRTLDLTKVDEKAAKLVMEKYAIQIRTKYVDATGPSYLNSAASGGTVYTATRKPGIYEVFEISAKAYKQMIWLEQDYLVTHGYSPRSSRVDTVSFGIVQKGNDWDLGILDIKVVQMAEIGKPKIEAQAPASPKGNE